MPFENYRHPSTSDRCGVILADKDRLRKTIEVGIALCRCPSREKSTRALLTAADRPLGQALPTKFGLRHIGIDQFGTEEGLVGMDYIRAYRALFHRMESVALNEAYHLVNAGLQSHIQSDTIREHSSAALNIGLRHTHANPVA